MHGFTIIKILFPMDHISISIPPCSHNFGTDRDGCNILIHLT